MTKQITTEDVRQFRARAIMDGDVAMVRRCDRALEGQPDAWWLVRTAISAESTR